MTADERDGLRETAETCEYVPSRPVLELLAELDAAREAFKPLAEFLRRCDSPPQTTPLGDYVPLAVGVHSVKGGEATLGDLRKLAKALT